MLSLSRRPGEKILIGENIEVIVSGISGGKVSLAIKAPKEVQIMREEIINRFQKPAGGAA